jgi:exopolysaccharide biosynthesis polyprenyl glycosylphosphotransferase
MVRTLNRYFLTSKKKTQYKLFLGDILLISISILTAYSIRVYLDPGEFTFYKAWDRMHQANLLFLLVHPLALYVLGLYSTDQKIKGFWGFIFVTWGVILGGFIAAAMLFFVPRFIIGRKILLFHLPILSLLLYGWRLLLFNRFEKYEKRSLALIGRGDTVSSFLEEINRDAYSEYEVKHVCIVDPDSQICVHWSQGIPLQSSVEGLLNQNSFQALAVDSALTLSRDEIKRIIDFRFNQSGEIYDLTDLYESITGKVPLSYIDGRWFMSNPGFQGAPNHRYLKVKRLFDFSLASLIGIFAFPVMILIAIAIKLESKGPILYVQERLGMNRIKFRCYKFRTMVANAEAGIGPIHSRDEDPRVTRVGKCIRKTRLDELPQVINILRGELSFVGPRPIREHFANGFSHQVPYYELRHNVKPGLTGWAQVHRCYAVPFGLEALQYELFYIQNMSMLLDLHILFKTLRTVLGGQGK